MERVNYFDKKFSRSASCASYSGTLWNFIVFKLKSVGEDPITRDKIEICKYEFISQLHPLSTRLNKLLYILYVWLRRGEVKGKSTVRLTSFTSPLYHRGASDGSTEYEIKNNVSKMFFFFLNRFVYSYY